MLHVSCLLCDAYYDAKSHEGQAEATLEGRRRRPHLVGFASSLLVAQTCRKYEIFKVAMLESYTAGLTQPRRDVSKIIRSLK